jgi:membrane protease YdiL (CAAX protease family)
MEKKSNCQLNACTSGLAYTTYVVFYAIVSIVISLVISLSGLNSASDGYKYLSYLVAPIAMGICVLLFAKVDLSKLSSNLQRAPLNDYVKGKCSPKYYLIALMLIFGLMFSLSYINEYVVKFFELFGYQQREEGDYLPNLSGGWLALAIFVIAVIPAVVEETFFRGLILTGCRRGTGDIRAIFIVGLLFALYHNSPEQTVYQFICGCLFAFLAIRAGSYLPCVLIHFINNAFILCAYAFGWIDESGSFTLSNGASIAVTILSAACFIGAIVWLVLDKKPLQKGQKGQTLKFFLFASAGLIAFIIIWLLLLFGVV